MRIGGAGVADQSEAYEGRSSPQGPTVGLQPSSGLAALGRAIGGLGEVGQNYLNIRMQEEQEAEDYRDLLRKNQFEGDWQRRAEELKMNMPADGNGYVAALDKEFKTSRDAFLKEVSPRNRARYEAYSEGLWQNSALQGDTFTRDATRGHALRTMEAGVEEARLRVYQDPDDEGAFDSVGELVATAPGLTAGERLDAEQKALETLNGAAVGGRIRQSRTAAYTVPGSADVRTRIIPAIRMAESGGNPGAVSSKGARGTMQIMPATGLEIALEIGDQNFPFKGSQEERNAYLSREGISDVYGTHYFNKQLKTFGGDIELALIAYNAGPARAIAFRDNGRNWSALPPGVQAETRPYVQKIFASIGAMTPEMAFDPAVGLNLDQAIGAEEALMGIYDEAQRDAALRVTTMLDEAEKRRGLLTDQMMYQTQFEGMNFPQAYRAAVDNGDLVYDQDVMNKGRAVYERVNEEALTYQKAVAKLTSGQALSPAEGDLLISPALLEGAAGGDEDSMRALTQRIEALGFVPPNTQTALGRMLYSTDLTQVNAAAQIIRTVEQTNPLSVSTMPDEVMARANSYETLRVAGLSSDQIAERMSANRTPQGARALDGLRRTKEYKDAEILTLTDVTKTFNGFLSRNVPGVSEASLVPDANTLNLLQEQYSELYDTFFSNTWDAAAAKELTLQHLSKQWGVTSTGGQERIMWYPPEQALQNLRIDTDGDGQLEVVQLPPEYSRHRFDRDLRAHFGMAEEDGYRIIATLETPNAIEDGKPIPYSVIPLDSSGNPAWNYDNPAHIEMLTRGFNFDYTQTTAADIEIIRFLNELERQRAALYKTIEERRDNGETYAVLDYTTELAELERRIVEVTKGLK